MARVLRQGIHDLADVFLSEQALEQNHPFLAHLAVDLKKKTSLDSITNQDPFFAENAFQNDSYEAIVEFFAPRLEQLILQIP